MLKFHLAGVTSKFPLVRRSRRRNRETARNNSRDAEGARLYSERVKFTSEFLRKFSQIFVTFIPSKLLNKKSVIKQRLNKNIITG